MKKGAVEVICGGPLCKRCQAIYKGVEDMASTLKYASVDYNV